LLNNGQLQIESKEEQVSLCTFIYYCSHILFHIHIYSSSYLQEKQHQHFHL